LHESKGGGCWRGWNRGTPELKQVPGASQGGGKKFLKATRKKRPGNHRPDEKNN